MPSLIDKWVVAFSSNGRPHPSRSPANTSLTVNRSFSSERGNRSNFDDRNNVDRQYGKHPDPELKALANMVNYRVNNGGPEGVVLAGVDSSYEQAAGNVDIFDKWFAVSDQAHSGESSAVHQSYRIGPNASNINDFYAKQQKMKQLVGKAIEAGNQGSYGR